MDDILITGRSIEEHDDRLKVTLDLLKTHQLAINEDKCNFRKKEVKFLGHSISHNRISPLNDKIEAIKMLPPPTNVRELRRILGMVNFHHKLIPNCAKIIFPMTKLLRKSNNAKFVWTPEADASVLPKLKACCHLIL